MVSQSQRLCFLVLLALVHCSAKSCKTTTMVKIGNGWCKHNNEAYSGYWLRTKPDEKSMTKELCQKICLDNAWCIALTFNHIYTDATRKTLRLNECRIGWAWVPKQERVMPITKPANVSINERNCYEKSSSGAACSYSKKNCYQSNPSDTSCWGSRAGHSHVNSCGNCNAKKAPNGVWAAEAKMKAQCFAKNVTMGPCTSPPAKSSTLNSNQTGHAYNAAANEYYTKLAAYEAGRRDHFLKEYNRATQEATAKVAEYNTDVAASNAAKLNFTARQAEAKVYFDLYKSHAEKHRKAVLALNHSAAAYKYWREMGIANAHWQFNDIMAKYAIGSSEIAQFTSKAKQYKAQYVSNKALYESAFKSHRSYSSVAVETGAAAVSLEVRQSGDTHVAAVPMSSTPNLLWWVGFASVVVIGSVTIHRKMRVSEEYQSL